MVLAKKAAVLSYHVLPQVGLGGEHGQAEDTLLLGVPDPLLHHSTAGHVLLQGLGVLEELATLLTLETGAIWVHRLYMAEKLFLVGKEFSTGGAAARAPRK